ncbi:hypothetical protein NRC85_003783 [Vibrio parahaemolyticus]|nr:hypothetical protein [Vibrio parahaemolyticus]
MNQPDKEALYDAIEKTTRLKRQYLEIVTLGEVNKTTLELCRDVMPMPLHYDNVVSALSVLDNIDFIVYGAIKTVGSKFGTQASSSSIVAGHCWLQLSDGTHVDPSIDCQPVVVGHSILLSERIYVEAFKVSKEELLRISNDILPPKLVGCVGIPLEGLSNLSSHSYLFN